MRVTTSVELLHDAGRTERWIRFGLPVSDRILDRRRRLLSFAPSQVFAFVQWAANDFGTVASRIDVVRAVRPGEPYQTLPFVTPGGDILLGLAGWPKVERVLRHIDAVEETGIAPQAVVADHWRHVAHRLRVGEDPRAYTAERHRAWLKRLATGL